MSATASRSRMSMLRRSGHGLKDLWQDRTHFVSTTRWWPPFCMTVDFVVAAIIVIEIAAGLHFR